VPITSMSFQMPITSLSSTPPPQATFTTTRLITTQMPITSLNSTSPPQAIFTTTRLITTQMSIAPLKSTPTSQAIFTTTRLIATTTGVNTAIPSPSALLSHHSHSPGVLVGSIAGGLVGFLLLALSATCIWRRRRVRRTIKRPDLYPAATIPEESLVPQSYWDGDSDLSSLAPSDSVSRAVHSFPKKVRPLAPSTTMTSVSEESNGRP
ncbi:hypothetical protein BDP27DRAFT_1319225, partial [Rhodocollybia butyracea]